jgi:hypothetical protein
MRIIGWTGMAMAALLAGGAPSGARAQGFDEVIRCESKDYRQVYCNIDSRGGVEIVNQLSETPCTEGRTWGWDRRGVWVSGGCRGEFAVAGRGRYDGGGRHDDGYGYGYDAGGDGALIRCESRDFNQIYCNADTRGGARLVNQLSSTPCIEGDTWGADRRGVWVRGGCRAEFEVGFRGGRGQGLPLDRPAYGAARGGAIVVCESRDNRYRHCPANIRREARLLRQLSDNQCLRNRSWGYDGNGVWVDRGCRAEFEIF